MGEPRTDMPAPRKQTEEQSVSRENGDMEVGVLQVDRCKPILGPNTFENAFGREHLEQQSVKSVVRNA